MFSVRKYKDRLSETHGVKLNSKTREIDVRIIDKKATRSSQNEMTRTDRETEETGRIDNAIAYFFERHNLIELKNPRENLNIDVFWKGVRPKRRYWK